MRILACRLSVISIAVAAFLSQSSRQAGLNAEILVQGGELRIIAGA